MDLRLDFSNIPSRRNTDEIELLSPRETPLHEARKISRGSYSARTADKDPLLPAVFGGKAPVSARPAESNLKDKASMKDMKVNKLKEKKAVFQMKTVAVFPTNSTNSAVGTHLPQVATFPAERKPDNATSSPKTKAKKPAMHELVAGSFVIEQEISLSESQLQLGAFPQRPALKKQDTSVVPDHVLLQRIRLKKADIVFTDSPVKGDVYQPSSPTTNTRVNTGHRSPSPSNARYERNNEAGEDGGDTFSSPLHNARTPSPAHRANPVLVISPYSSTTRIAETPSQALLNSAHKLKVAGFNIANAPSDKSPAGGSRKIPIGSLSSALDDQASELEAADAQGSKVLKVSIPRAIKSPEKQDRPERDCRDQKQNTDDLAAVSELRKVAADSSTGKTLLGDGVSKKESPEQVKQMPQQQTHKPTAGQGSSPKSAGLKQNVLLAGADSDPSAFTGHSLADDFLMQLRFHDNFKHDKDRDGLRAAGKTPRVIAAPAQVQQVSYKQQELVVPSMPMKPKPQQSFMSATARRNLALQASLQKAGSSKVAAKNPSSPEGDSLEGQLKRRAVNDTLSGIRTGATKGGLFQGGENVDFYDLLNGSAAVFAGAELSRKAQLARELEQERERIASAEAAAELAAQEAQLDPAVRAAIQAAQSVATKQGLLPHAISPHSALEKHAELLTDAEKEEVQAFAKVYFLGHSRDIKPPKAQGESTEADALVNGGYDNSGGHYLAPVGDHIRFRYEVLGTLGRGSFGDVFRCRDHKLGIDMAVKVIKNQPIFTAQAEKELMVLNLIRNPDMDTPTAAEMSSENKAVPADSAVDRRHHHHMIQLVDSFEFRHHKCFVFPICGINLYELLKSKNFAGLPMSFVRKAAVQLLDALTHLRSLNVIHCDIKPENILLRNEQSAAVVLIDFGSSCMAGQSTFTYIQSRFYRSPEVLLGLPYGFEIDLWSVACILPELRTAYPAFPGESAADQLACITEVLGYPPEEMYQRCPRKERHFDDSGVLMVETSPRGQARTPCSRSIETITSARRKDAQFVDFVTGCLKWLPEERLTLQQCTEHPWLCEGQTAAEEEGRSEDVLSPAARVRGSTEAEVLVATHVPGPSAPVPMEGLGDAELIQKINNNADRAKREIADQKKI